MWPVPRGRMRRIGLRVPWITAWRSISSWRGSRRVVLLLERAHGHDPRVVDEHVERPEAPLDLVEERGEARPVRHVEAQADGAPAELAAAASAPRRRRRRSRPGTPSRRQRERQRLADAAATAGDDGDLAVERARLLGHGSSSCLSTRRQETLRVTDRRPLGGTAERADLAAEEERAVEPQLEPRLERDVDRPALRAGEPGHSRRSARRASARARRGAAAAGATACAAGTSAARRCLRSARPHDKARRRGSATL